MKYKTSKEMLDASELYDRNGRLLNLLVQLDLFTELEFGKEIVITSVQRTKEENKAANASSEIHCYWGAADVRSSDFNKDQIDKILAFCNLFRYTGTAGHKVAMLHTVSGGAEHIHIQMPVNA